MVNSDNLIKKINKIKYNIIKKTYVFPSELHRPFYPGPVLVKIASK